MARAEPGKPGQPSRAWTSPRPEGRELYDIRCTLDLDQTAFARLLGLKTQHTLSELERGVRAPKGALLSLARKLLAEHEAREARLLAEREARKRGRLPRKKES
jgi:DNA-binding transcriptional regulator YiaG